MVIDAGDALVRSLQTHNPWWETGEDAFSLPAREKSDFYHLARPTEQGSQIEDTRLLGIVGRRGVGKTTLLRQFIHHRIQTGDEPERFLYLPFDANPLYQLHSDDQLRRAVRYYESRILARIEQDEPHFLFLDDVHQIEHPTKPTIDGWGPAVSELLGDEPGRHIVVTANAGVQVERTIDRVDIPDEEYDVQPILPEKFRDYIFSIYPELEEGDTRLSPTSIRTGEASLPQALESGDVGPFVDELSRKFDQIDEYERQIQSQVVDYLAMGGTISFESEGAIESASDITEVEYSRLREDVRQALYQDVPGFESIQTIADLERLCALAAKNTGVDPIRYQDLVELFDADRRTITNSYLPALAQLYLLTGATEYDNDRPRAVKLYLRDTGLLTALAYGEASAISKDFGRESDLAKIAAYDHTMRFSYGINAMEDPAVTPNVQYWQGRDGEVDFVFEVVDTPVPLGMAYRSSEREDAVAGLREFLTTYDVPFGFMIEGDTVRGESGIDVLDDDIIRLPYWFYLMLS